MTTYFIQPARVLIDFKWQRSAGYTLFNMKAYLQANFAFTNLSRRCDCFVMGLTKSRSVSSPFDITTLDIVNDIVERIPGAEVVTIDELYDRQIPWLEGKSLSSKQLLFIPVTTETEVVIDLIYSEHRYVSQEPTFK